MKQIREKIKLIRNEIVLDTYETYRILGWTDSYEEDLYWVCLAMESGKGMYILYYSCVGGFIRLRDTLKNEDYEQLEKAWNMNGGTVEYGLELIRKDNIKVL